MPTTQVQDRPGTVASDFSASLGETPGLPHNMTVSGKAIGDYRISDVHLVKAHHQPSAHILVLDVVAKIGPVENPHPELERVWPLEFKEAPAQHRYTEVKIVNGPQHFMVKVIDIL